MSAAFAVDANATPVINEYVTPLNSQDIGSEIVTPIGESRTVLDSTGDQFNFVLKKAQDTGLMMVYHSSHSSHSSHYSRSW